MKHRCYPKSKYITLFVLALLLLAFAFIPYFLKEGSIPLYAKIIWTCFLVLLSLSILYLAIVNFQYFKVLEDEIIVKCLFYEITRLKLSNCEVVIEELPTYSGVGLVNNFKWICLYDINKKTVRFQNGCTNGRKESRIQVIYNEKNEKALAHII